jgi:hypothetical protein
MGDPIIWSVTVSHRVGLASVMLTAPAVPDQALHSVRSMLRDQEIPFLFSRVACKFLHIGS